MDLFRKKPIKNNKKDNWPKRYRSEFIEPGICSYEDVGMGLVYIGTETLDKMNQTFIGKPVVNEVHKDLTAEQAYKLSNEDMEVMADGIVYDVGRLSNGWYYNDMLIWDLDTQKNIDEKGYTVSCAYFVTDSGEGGVHNQINYDEEVLNAFYTHNCITSNPRYNGVKIYELPYRFDNSKINQFLAHIKNSKGEKMSGIFKIFNSKPNSLENQEVGEERKDQEEYEKTDNAEGKYIDVNGQKVPLEEAISAYKSMMENVEEETQVLTEEDVVEIDGEKVSVSELVAACTKMKDNAEPPQDEEAENVVESQNINTKNNSVKKLTTSTKKKQKINHFKIVKNAATKNNQEEIKRPNTSYQRLQNGKNKYGKKGE